jgi:hypothetical protein
MRRNHVDRRKVLRNADCSVPSWDRNLYNLRRRHVAVVEVFSDSRLLIVVRLLCRGCLSAVRSLRQGRLSAVRSLSRGRLS